MSTYVLPELPYDYAALEPHISAAILELHHGKHHAAYVKNANHAIEKLEEARAKDDFERIADLERALAFNLSGHILHSLFWKNLAPQGGAIPEGRLYQAIERDFGGMMALRRHMNEAATTIMGSGWAALVWEPVARRLLVTQVYDHQSNLTQGSVPLMVLDAWEHAYYLQYQNRKADYFNAIWNCWNWRDISVRFQLTVRVDMGLEQAAK